MNKILIVEDEMLIAAKISLQLSDLGFHVTDMLSKGEDVEASIRAEKPNLIIMDINLKGEMDGIETAKQINSLFKIPFIYLTANTDELHFRKAKNTKPAAFLSKPFNKIDLKHAIELAISDKESELAPVVDIYEEPKVIEDRIFIRHHDTLKKVSFEEIHYLEAERNYCKIHLQNTTYLIASPLKKLFEKLPTSTFIRVHRSYVINLYKLDEVGSNNVLIDKKAIPLSKSHKDHLYKRLHTI